MQSINPRRAVVGIVYNGKSVETSLEQYLETFSYVDEANGNSDTIDIQLQNIDKKWLNEWMPVKGDKLIVQVKTYNWETQNEDWYKNNDMKIFKCGSFLLDEFSFSGRPLECNIKAISSPSNSSFSSTKRTKTWEKATIQTIASEAAKRAGISLHYDAETIQIKVIEQSSQSDSEFLSSLCKDYGLYMKIYADKIVIFNPATYDKKKVVAEIGEKDMLQWSWNTTTEGTYTAGKMQYTDAKSDKDYICKVGAGSRVLEVTGKADSKEDAKAKVISAVNIANRGATTMSISIMANLKIIASSCVAITGLGKLNGKYFVNKVTHNVGSGYTMQLELSKVVTPLS